jgi:hypothetical protein
MRFPYHGFAVKFLLFLALGSLAVMLLWNAVVTSALGLGPLGYWQAMGLLALCRVLFGSFGLHGHHLSRGWHRLSPEERMGLFRGRRHMPFGQGDCPGGQGADGHPGRPGDLGGNPG